MAVVLSVTTNPQAMNRLAKDPGGPVGLFVASLAVRVESQMKVNASGRPGPNVRTGRLRSSLRAYPTQPSPLGPYANVGSNVEYAGYVERGTDRAPPYRYARPALTVVFQ